MHAGLKQVSRVAGAAGALLLLSAATAFAGTVSWYETSPTGVSLVQTAPGQPVPTMSWGVGTDTLYSQVSYGLSSPGSIGYSATASAQFNYVVTWTPNPGDAIPVNAVFTFNRYAADYASCSAGMSPYAYGNVSVSVTSSSPSGPYAHANVSINSGTPNGSSTQGTNTLTYVGQYAIQAPLVQVGSYWQANIAVPCSAASAVSVNSSVNSGQGGGGGGATTNWKQVAVGATVTY